MEGSAHMLEAEAQVLLPCPLAFQVRARFRQASLQPRQGIRQPLQASAAHALARPLLHLAQPARSTRPRHQVYHQLRRVTILLHLPVILQRRLAIRQHLPPSLQLRQHTAQLRQRILEPLRHTIALHHPVSAPHRRSTARQAHNLTQAASADLLLHQRHPPSALPARRTLPLAQRVTRNTRRRRHGTLLPHRARRHTHRIRGGRQPAQHTRRRLPNKTRVS
jgi:hypothetical protein